MIRINVLLIYVVAFLMPRVGFIRAYILWALGLFIFNVGHLFREKRILDRIDTKIFLVFCVLLLFGSRMCDINIIQMRIGNPITYALFGIVGICVVMKIAKATIDFNTSMIAYMGNSSLCILEWHYYIFLIITFLIQYLIQRKIPLNSGFISYNSVPMILKPCLFVAYVVSGICIPLMGKKYVLELKERIGRKQHEKHSNT